VVLAADGTRVQVWDCNGTPAQLWFYDAQRRLHPYAAPTKCLDLNAGGTTNGNYLQIWECGTQGNQIFNTNVPNLNPQGLLGTAVQNNAIRSALNGLCTDVFSYNYNNGAPVVMFTCNGQNNQRWQLDARGALRSTHNTNKCLDASANNAGEEVQHGAASAVWRLQQAAPHSENIVRF
jgi:endo-1,4-beta-xylanase